MIAETPPSPLASEELAELRVDVALYSEEALFRACHRFTDRCYLHLVPAAEGQVIVEFRRKSGEESVRDLQGEFANELIDQRVRCDLEKATRHLRDRIVAQAFGEADFDRVASGTQATSA